ncbi:polyprenyl synthetase family protein [Nitratifractor sp.]
MVDFENFIAENLPRIESFHPSYEEALAEMLLAGGKRFRPRLLLSVVEACEPLLVDSAMIPALALEVFHTYSLIHDDLPAMDDAPLRRGHPTLHTRYGDALAILAGDALNTFAFELLADSPFRDDVKIRLVRILAENGGTGGMVLGQALDLYFEGEALSLEQVEELHRNKTAKLIAASLEMGAVIVGLEPELQQELYDFGIELGLLFQVQDDILDATQSSEEAGKPTLHDTEKNSFVTLLGLDEAMKYADRLAERLVGQLESYEPRLRNALEPLLTSYLWRHRQD